jgi:predicted Zn-dependent protease
MTWFRLYVFLLLLLIAGALPAAAQTERCPDAAALFADGLYDRAATAYECLLAAQPDDPDLHRGLIPAYLMAGRYYDAVEQLRPLRRLFPEDSGQAYLTEWESALRTGRTIPDRVTRAFLLWTLANDREAQPIYAQLIAEADGVPAEFARVFALSSELWLEAATPERTVEAALALDTDNPQALAFIADTLRYAASADHVERLTAGALERFPDDPPLMLLRAIALIDLDRPAEAAPLIEQVEQSASGAADLDLYQTLADAYARLGDVANTERALDRAVELGLTEDLVIYTLMTAYENAGDLEAASRQALAYLDRARRATIRRDLGGADAGTYTIAMREGTVFELRFEAMGGVPYTFRALSVNPGQVDPFLVLLAPDGTPIAFNDDRDAAAGDLDAQIDQVVLTDGTYTLVIGHAAMGSTGPVEVSIGVY